MSVQIKVLPLAKVYSFSKSRSKKRGEHLYLQWVTNASAYRWGRSPNRTSLAEYKNLRDRWGTSNLEKQVCAPLTELTPPALVSKNTANYEREGLP
jgi:hypothetical protein